MPEEAQLYPLPRILAEDFAEFPEILAADGDFPRAHAVWERLAEARWNALADDGYIAKFIDIRPGGFRRFVAESGDRPSMNALAAYVAFLVPFKPR